MLLALSSCWSSFLCCLFLTSAFFLSFFFFFLTCCFFLYSVLSFFGAFAVYVFLSLLEPLAVSFSISEVLSISPFLSFWILWVLSISLILCQFSQSLSVCLSVHVGLYQAPSLSQSLSVPVSQCQCFWFSPSPSHSASPSAFSHLSVSPSLNVS